MEQVLARLPAKLQLDWCTRGFEGVPWFVPGSDVRIIRITGSAPIEAVEAIDPIASVMLAAWLKQRRSAGATTILDDSAKSVHALQAGLLRVLAGKVGETVGWISTPGGHRLVPPAQLSRQELINPLLKQIRFLLHLDKESAEAVLYCLSELLRNVFEHAASPEGAFIAAGHYPSKERITIAIADLGMTVPVHMRKQYGEALDDESALRAALEPRASGSFDTNRNAGLGLYKTRRVADMTGGKFWMMTGDLCARQDGDVTLGGHSDVEIRRCANPWKGTVVALTLKPKGIVSFNRTSRLINEELMGGALVHRLQFSRKMPLEGSEVIAIPPDAGNMAQDKSAAATIRREKILPALRAGKTLTLSFRGVALTTQSFIHALLAEPLRELGPSSAPNRIAYLGPGNQVREVIQLVVGYVLEELMTPEDATGGPDPSPRTPASPPP